MDLWYPKAIRLDGPAWKQGYAGITTRQGKGLIGHSAEGRLTAALSTLDSSSQVSWCLFNTYDGTFYQHYPLSAVTWHGGCVFANAHFVGVEHEGRAGEPLTQAQVAALAEFIAWLAEQEDWPSIERHVTLFEHREMAAYGAAPTACPSGRIPWEKVIDMVTIDYVARAAAEAAQAKADQNAYRERIAGLILSGDGETAYRETQLLRKFCGLPLVVV